MKLDPAVQATITDPQIFKGFLELYFNSSVEACDYGLWKLWEAFSVDDKGYWYLLLQRVIWYLKCFAQLWYFLWYAIQSVYNCTEMVIICNKYFSFKRKMANFDQEEKLFLPLFSYQSKWRCWLISLVYLLRGSINLILSLFGNWLLPFMNKNTSHAEDSFYLQQQVKIYSRVCDGVN